MSIFTKKTFAERLIQQLGASICGPNILVIDEMLNRISNLTPRELDLLPFLGEDISKMYSDNADGFNAAFDTGLMCGRIDAVVACQDEIGKLAEKKVSRLRRIPGDKTCGPAIISIQAVTALIVRDLVGSTFSTEDQQRASMAHFTPKATSFTQEHFNAAVAPWVTAFGTL